MKLLSSRCGDPLKLRRRSAFTLIELVISAALMSLILVSAYLCVSAATSSQKLIEARAEVGQSARVALAMMTADLRCACPLSKDYDFVGMPRMLGDIEADNLDFATHNFTPRRRGEGDWSEMSYFLDRDRETGTFSLWRRRDPTPDPEPLAGGRREEIARGVAGLKFEYYDGFDWYDRWGDVEGKGQRRDSWLDRPNLYGMPEAVRITLWLDANPSRTKKNDSITEKAEAPSMFQTVVRLELADREQRSSATGGSPTQTPSGGSSGPGQTGAGAEGKN